MEGVVLGVVAIAISSWSLIRQYRHKLWHEDQVMAKYAKTPYKATQS